MNILVPEKSLCCGSAWSGGHEVPGKPMQIGLRVFYDCGSSLSIYSQYADPKSFLLLTKNCCKEDKDVKETS